MVEVSKHAEKRIRKRLGVKRSAVDKIAEDAFNTGIKHKDTSGRLKKFIDGLFLYHKHKAGNIRIKNRYVFIFSGETLITVFEIPARLR